MKIVLLGYMGSGKTSVGKRLAAQLGIQFLDLDDCIEKAEQIDIPEIFATKGELYFRKKEYEYLVEILNQKDDFVLSTGGGTPCYGNNLEAILKTTDYVFYLKVSIAELVKRLSKEKSERPLIKNIPNEELSEFIGKHLFERSYFYNQAHYKVDCTNKDVDSISNEIVESIQ